MDWEIAASGDLMVDAHHTVEDVGITLGQAISDLLAEKRGLTRYGHAMCPWMKQCHAWLWTSPVVPV